MRVGGIQWMTLLDYPDRVAATVFTAGCNLRCPFCHNAELVLPELIAESSQELGDVFFDALSERAGFLDAVVLSGGEPTLQPDLPSVLREIRAMGFLTKLDTNGTYPDILEALLNEGLLDFVAMDIKGPREAYADLVGVPVDLAAIGRSIELLRTSGLPYEFRTTCAPGIDGYDIEQIVDWIDGSHSYWLQRFQAPEGKRLVDDAMRLNDALKRDALETVWHRVQGRFGSGGVRV